MKLDIVRKKSMINIGQHYYGKNMLVCIVGMTGSGKSIVADEFHRAGFSYVRFGQIVLDEVKRRGLAAGEKSEKGIRLSYRQKYGMAAMAILNIPKFDRLLRKENVVGDGLYSWAEYKILKEKYGNKLFVLAVYSLPHLRYQRLVNRRKDVVNDPNLRYRSFSIKEAKERDYHEIENIEKAGPIAMADYTIVNNGSKENVIKDARKIIQKLVKKGKIL